MTHDHVAHILEQWQKQHPDVDVSPMGIIGRLSRLTRDAESKLDANFKRFGLDGVAFDLLAALRRQGEPFALNPANLQYDMMLSSGSTTYRIDQLEKKGLVTRRPDPNDRRGTLVMLTKEGLNLVDEILTSHVQVEAEYLAALTLEQRKTLAQLLTVLTKEHHL